MPGFHGSFQGGDVQLCPCSCSFAVCSFVYSYRQPGHFGHSFKAGSVCEGKFFICLSVCVQGSCLSIPHCSAWLKMGHGIRKSLKIKFWHCLLNHVVQYRKKRFCGMKWLALRIQHGCFNNFGKYCFCLG